MADCDHIFALTPWTECGKSITICHMKVSNLAVIRKNMRACLEMDIAETKTYQAEESRILSELTEEGYFRRELMCLDYCPNCGTKNTVFPFPETTDG